MHQLRPLIRILPISYSWLDIDNACSSYPLVHDQVPLSPKSYNTKINKPKKKKVEF